MKKLLSKALAVVMAAALCVGMCATAFAAGTSVDDTGSVTVNGLEAGVTASAYQIAHATYDNDGNFLGYQMNVTVTGGFVINSDGSYDEDALTEANLAALYAALNGATATSSAVADSDGVAKIENLPVGSYLIVIEGSESVIYGMMIGSVSYITEDGEWAIDSGEITDVANCELWAKSTTPTVLKEETGGHLEDGDYEHGGSADVGDTIEYHITVDGIPSYQGSYPEFIVTDELSTELTITDAELNDLYIMIDGEEDNILDSSLYTVERTENGFTINFVVNGVYTLNEYAGHMLVIDFCADVTSASGQADDHENDVTLTYATTSYATGSEGKDQDEDHEYTFELQAQKTDKNEAALAGADFALYTDETCETPYTQGDEVVTATSGEDGYFTFTGLEEGTYYLKETEAPAGYILDTSVYKVVISATYTAQDTKEGGELESWTIVITDENGNEVASITQGSATGLTFVNEAVEENPLPSTGGMGTTIFYIIGGVLVAGAVVVLVTRRRMSHEA